MPQIATISAGTGLDTVGAGQPLERCADRVAATDQDGGLIGAGTGRPGTNRSGDTRGT
jgi:hypothetical protein